MVSPGRVNLSRMYFVCGGSLVSGHVWIMYFTLFFYFFFFLRLVITLKKRGDEYEVHVWTPRSPNRPAAFNLTGGVPLRFTGPGGRVADLHLRTQSPPVVGRYATVAVPSPRSSNFGVTVVVTTTDGELLRCRAQPGQRGRLEGHGITVVARYQPLPEL